MQYQSISMQNRYFAYFSAVSHIGVDFRILICEFAYAWRPWIYVGLVRSIVREILPQAVWR